MTQRDPKGKFTPKPNSLGKTYGVRVRKDLDAAIADLAAESGLTPTEYCRRAVEDAIAARKIYDPPSP